MSPDLAFNTAVSFVTNTNWQAYGGETTLSYFSQMVGLTVAELRLRRHRHGRWRRRHPRLRRPRRSRIARQFLGRSHPLDPLRPAAAVDRRRRFCSSGRACRRTSCTTSTATTLEGAQQIIAQGPVASQVAIKQLGTNGGGFFNANSAVPYENPTPLSNLIEMVSILLIPAAFCFMFGRMARDCARASRSSPSCACSSPARWR